MQVDEHWAEDRDHARCASRDPIVAFCWDNPKLLPSYLELVRAVQDEWRVEVVFVTTGVETKMRVIAEGYDAVTTRELFAITATRPASEVPVADPARLDELDRLLDLHWYPAPEGIGSQEYHGWQVERTFAAYEYLLDQVRPRVVMVWNGGALLPGALAAIAKSREIPVFYIERGLLPGTLMVDPRGVNYGSAIAGDRWNSREVPEPSPEDRLRMLNYCRGLCESGQTVVVQGMSIGRDASRDRLRIPRGARVILFPLQIESDTNILRYSPHYKRMVDIIRDLKRWAAGAKDAALIVKPHPEDSDRLEGLRRECDDVTRVATDVSVRSLIEASDVIVTVNSTVGLEALIAQKPVVVLGNAIYGGKGFTYDLQDTSRLDATIDAAVHDASAGQFALSNFLRFMVFLRKHCLFDLDPSDPWGSRTYISQRIRMGGAASRTSAPMAAGRKPITVKAEGFYDLIRGVARLAPKRVVLAWTPAWLDELVRSDEGTHHVRRIRSKWDLDQVIRSWFRSFDVAVTVGGLARRRRLIWHLLRAREKLELI